MARDLRPRRSVLYMPASRASALEKAKTLPADAFIFDLEDAVSPDAKDTARGMAMAAGGNPDYGAAERIVRVNGLDTPWGYADLVAVAKSGAHAVLIPKVESGATVRQIDAILTANGAPDDLAVWVMVETPLAMLRIDDVARAGGRLRALVMGTSDLAKELHASHTRDRLPFMTGIGLCLLAARAYGLVALDGVHLDLADDAAFEAVCKQGRELGFDGKTLIHPKQVEPCNRAFAPSEAEVERARRIIAAHAAAIAEGKGVVLVDGQLIENLHVAEAHSMVAIADAIAARVATS